MHIKEGMAKGDTLAMIAYGIGVLHLIRELWGAHTQQRQPWYAYDAEAGGGFPHILARLRDLQARGLPRGYFPEPNKSFLVVAPRNVAKAEGFFRAMGLQVVTGSR